MIGTEQQMAAPDSPSREGLVTIALEQQQQLQGHGQPQGKGGVSGWVRACMGMGVPSCARVRFTALLYVAPTQPQGNRFFFLLTHTHPYM